MYEGTALSIVTGQGTFCVEGEQQTCKARGTSVMWIFLEFDQVVVVPRTPQSESLLLRHCASFLTNAGARVGTEELSAHLLPDIAYHQFDIVRPKPMARSGLAS